MLFDLRGAGRRRIVKAVYITLAILMGGGLVLFGIGGDGISGGLVDAFTERSGGGDDGADRFRKQEKAALAKTKANPQDAAAWAALARARFQLAGAGDELRSRQGHLHRRPAPPSSTAAGDAWERYLALDPPKPDDRVASLMVQAFGAPQRARQGGRRPRRSSPTPARRPSTFTQLAIFAYQAGQTRKGDLAKDKALELDRPGHARGAQGPARAGRSSPRPTQPPPRSPAPTP